MSVHYFTFGFDHRPPGLNGRDPSRCHIAVSAPDNHRAYAAAYLGAVPGEPLPFAFEYPEDEWQRVVRGPTWAPTLLARITVVNAATAAEGR